MQAIHANIYGVAWIETPEGWCNRALQHAAGGGQSRIVASPNVVNLHFFGDASSPREGSQYCMDQSPGGWWLMPLRHSGHGRETRIVTSPTVLVWDFFGHASISRRDLYCRMDSTTWWLVVSILRCSRGGRKIPTDRHLTKPCACTSLDMHALHEEIYNAACSEHLVVGGRWLVHCDILITGEALSW
jgi:hypothetical protein